MGTRIDRCPEDAYPDFSGGGFGDLLDEAMVG
jgi:hypothetical protein